MLEKLTKTRERKAVLFVTLIATLLLVIGVIKALGVPKVEYSYTQDELDYYENENKYSTPGGIDYPRGIYNVRIDYRTSEDLNTDVSVRSQIHNPIYTDNPKLDARLNTLSYDIYVNGKGENLVLTISGGAPEYTFIDNINIKTAWNSRLNMVVRYLGYYLLYILAMLLFVFREKFKDRSLDLVVIASVTLFASFGLFARYLLPGHDLEFHLLRIEGLKDALLLGDFPTKIQTNWCSGWGYAVSVAYGDTTLLIPAFLRLCGFTVQFSYKFFVFTVNLLTALSAYFCFGKMAKDRRATLIMTFLYTLAPYRLVCIYIRAAVGEFTALVFLPMIALGFYRAYMEDPESEDYGKKLLVPVLGFTLLMQTHLLSCVMMSIFIFILCVILWKKTFNKKTFVYLSKIALLSLVSSLWFLIPLIRFLNEPLMVVLKDNYRNDYQYYGLSIPEIFAQKASGCWSFNFAFLTSLKDRLSMPLGNAFVVIMMAYICLSWKGTIKKNRVPVFILMGLGTLSTFMASNLFPYSFLYVHARKLCDYLIKVQFPYRYISMSIFFFTMMVGFAFPQIVKKASKALVVFIAVITVLVGVDQAAEIIYANIYSGYYEVKYDGAGLDNNQLIGAEYVYEGTDTSIPLSSHEVYGESVEIVECSNIKNRYDIKVSAFGENPSLQIPLYYYPGYVATTSDGSSLKVERGDNNRIKIEIPDGFNGDIKVRYKEFALWRFCEIVSLALLIGLVIFEFKPVRIKKLEEDKVDKEDKEIKENKEDKENPANAVSEKE
ncbi:MAG: hypothetical protein K6F84_01890 [Lachnospiraceae bacterium]|nr:hypothetical protein [Lachnospiraceae bacterium]